MDEATRAAIQQVIDTIDLELGAEAIEDDDPAVYAALLRSIARPTPEQLADAGRQIAALRERLENDPIERQRIQDLGHELEAESDDEEGSG